MLCCVSCQNAQFDWGIRAVSHESQKSQDIFVRHHCVKLIFGRILDGRQDAGPGADVITHNAAMAACKSLVGTNMRTNQGPEMDMLHDLGWYVRCIRKNRCLLQGGKHQSLCKYVHLNVNTYCT